MEYYRIDTCRLEYSLKSISACTGIDRTSGTKTRKHVVCRQEFIVRLHHSQHKTSQACWQL